MQLVLKTKRKIISFNVGIYFTSSQAEIDTLHNTAYKIKKKKNLYIEIKFINVTRSSFQIKIAVQSLTQ